MDFDNSFESSFSDDDDAEFLALTARPRKDNESKSGSTDGKGGSGTIETQQDLSRQRTTASSEQSRVSGTNEHGQTNVVELNNKYLEAVGEIAILRGKLKEIEQNKSQQLKNLALNHKLYSKDKEEKINTLEQQLKKLEEEKHFYIAELKNPYSNRSILSLKKNSEDTNVKKRKIGSSEYLTNGSFATAKTHYIETSGKDVADVEMVDVSCDSRRIADTKKTLHKPHLRRPDYKSLFLESVWNHCLLGNTRTTIEMLSDICITFDYSYKSLNVRKQIDLLSTPIINYLVNANDNLRINEIVADFLLLLIGLLQELITRKEFLATPLLLALLHNSLVFRTNVVTKDALRSVLKFTVSAADTFFLLLDAPSVVNSKTFSSQAKDYLETRVIENNQTMILQSFDLIFLLDVLESLCKVAAGLEDQHFVKEIWTSIIPVELIRFCLSLSCPINCIVSMVECLSSSVTDEYAVNLSVDRQYNFEKKYCDKELVKLLLALFTSNIEIKPHTLIYGLNRALGNNSRSKLFDEIYPKANPLFTKSPGTLLNVAFPLSANSERALKKIDKGEKKCHEEHVFFLKSSIFGLLESYMAVERIPEVSFINSAETVKALVEEMRRQQEFIMRKPRSYSVSHRVDLLSSMILFLAPLILDNSSEEDDISKNLISRISAGTKRQMIVVLTRIAFSSTFTTEAALELLTEARIKLKYDGFMFNEFCERKARQLSGIRNITDTNRSQLVQEESSFANGLEFGFNDDIIGLARDILEVCITPDEADNLYYAFIAEDPDE